MYPRLPAFLHPVIGFLALTFAQSSHGATYEGYALPDHIEAQEHALDLAGCGLREMLWADLYMLGLYLPAPDTQPSRIRDPQTPKAFRLEVIYDGNLPEDLPNLWQEPLRQAIDRELFDILLELYEQVQTGDILVFSHDPLDGTAVTLNGELTVSQENTNLMNTLLAMWLGEDPVSRNLRHLLLSGSC